MSDERINIDDLFRDELGSYAETPPPAAWSALEKKLAARPGGPASRGRMVWYLGVLCLVLLLSIPAIQQLPGVFNGDDSSNGTHESELASATIPGIPAEAPAAPGQQSTTTPDAAPGNQVNGSNEQASYNNTYPNSGTNTYPNNKNTNNNTIAGSYSEPDDNTPTAPKNKNRHSNKTIPEGKYAAAEPYYAHKNNDGTLDSYVVVHDYAQLQEREYNSSSPNPAPVDAEENKNEETKDDEPETKKDDVNDNEKNKSKKPPTKKSKPVFNKFELGIKGGYERSFDNYGAKKFLVSPYMQYNLSPKFSIMTQPSVKYAQVDSRKLGKKASYYKVNSSTVTQTTDSVPVYIIGAPGDSLWLWQNTYTQTHDSVVKSYTTRDTYIEFDAPLLMKYNISKTISVYGGVNFTYSRLVGIQENTYAQKDISRSVTKTTLGRANSAPPAAQHGGELFVYNTAPYSNYSGPLYPTTNESSLRVGYMVGFSVEFTNRWLLDGLVQQATVKPNMQDGYNLNTAISAPYVRFTLGYKLLK